MAVVMAAAGAALGQTAFYERATQGPIGQTSGQGIAVDNLFYTGWRFQVTNGPIQTTHIGGHFYAFGSGSVFGAIVQLTGPNDDPDNFDLSTPDRLGTTLVPLPSGSSNVAQGNLSLTLQNGWYLVVFGSGAFGATATTGTLVAQDASTAVPGAQLNITYRQASHPAGPGVFLQGAVARVFVEYATGAPCYANCDSSTTQPVVNTGDFTCFLQQYSAAVQLPAAQQQAHYANCDGSTTFPMVNTGDFTCFLQKYAAGCS
jgi:hypothetical protein